MSPAAAGAKANLPIDSDISMAGIKRDHTEAAIMTPEAKPSRAFCINGLISFFNKKTQAAPKVVPRNGINSPIKVCIELLLSLLILYHTPDILFTKKEAATNP